MSRLVRLEVAKNALQHGLLRKGGAYELKGLESGFTPDPPGRDLGGELAFDEGQPVCPLEILQFLASWLKNHILETDQKLGSFLNQKGVT